VSDTVKLEESIATGKSSLRRRKLKRKILSYAFAMQADTGILISQRVARIGDKSALLGMAPSNAHFSNSLLGLGEIEPGQTLDVSGDASLLLA
jgi:hypothetical protein